MLYIYQVGNGKFVFFQTGNKERTLNNSLEFKVINAEMNFYFISNIQF